MCLCVSPIRLGHSSTSWARVISNLSTIQAGSPMQIVAVDIVGPFSEGHSGRRYNNDVSNMQLAATKKYILKLPAI